MRKFHASIPIPTGKASCPILRASCRDDWPGNRSRPFAAVGMWCIRWKRASICSLRSSTYSQTVLDAINLGEDTDTTACVAGGMAGVLYGEDAIPKDWLARLRDENTWIRGSDSLSTTCSRRILNGYGIACRARGGIAWEPRTP